MNFNPEKINNNEESKAEKLRKLGKKAVLSAALAAGLSTGSGEAVAQNQDDLEKDKIENVESNNPYEHLVSKVNAEELENILEEYENVPGGFPKETFLSQNANEIFYVSKPSSADIASGAQVWAHSDMRRARKLTAAPSDFVRNTSSGYTYITVTLKKDVDSMPAEAKRTKKHFDERERLDNLVNEYRNVKDQLKEIDPSQLDSDGLEKAKKLYKRFLELEKELEIN